MTLIERIQTIIHTHKLSPASFADKIGVQRSSVSHVLNGRNKPSLDFIEKILVHFPKVDATWLIAGKEKLISEKVEPLKPILPLNHSDKEIKQIVIFYTDGQFEVYKNE